MDTLVINKDSKLEPVWEKKRGSLEVTSTTKQEKPPGIVDTVDGWNPANQLRLVVFPIIYRVSYIPGGAGFQPSTVGKPLFWAHFVYRP